MWEAYYQELEVTDLKSGIESLREKLQRLQLDSEHEAVYGMGRFYSEEECYQIANTYKHGQEACDSFLTLRSCIECFVDKLLKLNLAHFLHPLKEFLPISALEKLDFSETESISGSEEEN